jgi:PKD repeat protein
MMKTIILNNSSGPNINLNLYSFFATLCCFVGLIFQPNTGYAQNLGQCHSKEVILTEAKLVADVSGTELTSPCISEATVPAYLKVTMYNKTSVRYGFFISADVYIDGEYTQTISECFNPTSGFHRGNNSVTLSTQITNWTCGKLIEIKNAYTSWGGTSYINDNCSYANVNNNYGSPHCRVYGVQNILLIQSPVIADFTTTPGSCPDNIYTFTNTSNGGKGTLSYEWDFEDGSPKSTETNPTHSFAPGTYTVTLTTTDQSTPQPEIDAQTIEFTVESCCTPSTAPTGISGTATICNGGNTTLTPTGGTLGTGASYKWYTDAAFTTDAPGTPDATTGALQVSPTTTTTYYVRIEGATSPCTAPAGSASKEVVVNNPISVSSWTKNEVTAIYGDASATFSVTASNVVSYQWQKTTATGNTFSPITGETNSSITINNPVIAMDGTQYKVDMTATAPCPAVSRTGTLKVNPYQICPDYTGLTFVNTNTSGVYTENGGKIKLTVFLPSLPGAGTLTSTNPQVNFYYSTTGGNTLIGTATYTAPTASNLNPSWSIDWTLPNPAIQSGDGATYTISWVVSGNYSNTNCNNGSTLITVAKPSSEFTTGGGYILNTNSKEILGRINPSPQAPSGVTKNNFGFNVKWNKNFTNLQGEFTTLIRKDGKLYQVKSNKPSYLKVDQLPAITAANGKTIIPYKATIVYSNAVIKSLGSGGCGLVPNCSVGAGTVSMIIVDNGEPGSLVSPKPDQIGFTVRDQYNLMYYATDNYSNLASDASRYFVLNDKYSNLDAGNIQVHVAGAKTSQPVVQNNSTQGVVDQLVSQRLSLRALPNPSRNSFTLQLLGKADEKMQVRVVDIIGRTVQQFNNLSAGQTLKIGADYKKGVYIVELVQGDSRTQTKLVKTD